MPRITGVPRRTDSRRGGLARILRRHANEMIQPHGQYDMDDDLRRIDFARVHNWLTGSYWSPGVSLQIVERAARNSSLVIGAYLDSLQVGYARVVSDRTTFAWICDVFADEAHRRHGIARAMLSFALAHPEHQNL